MALFEVLGELCMLKSLGYCFKSVKTAVIYMYAPTSYHTEVLLHIQLVCCVSVN